MRYFIAAAIITAVMVTPARAQFSSGKEKTPLDLLYEKQQRDREDNERQYDAQMKRLKAQGPAATSSDPWKGVRSSGGSDGKR